MAPGSASEMACGREILTKIFGVMHLSLRALPPSLQCLLRLHRKHLAKWPALVDENTQPHPLVDPNHPRAGIADGRRRIECGRHPGTHKIHSDRPDDHAGLDIAKDLQDRLCCRDGVLRAWPAEIDTRSGEGAACGIGFRDDSDMAIRHPDFERSKLEHGGPCEQRVRPRRTVAPRSAAVTLEAIALLSL